MKEIINFLIKNTHTNEQIELTNKQNKRIKEQIHIQMNKRIIKTYK